MSEIKQNVVLFYGQKRTYKRTPILKQTQVTIAEIVNLGGD
jgi:hypothetical protein